MLLCSLLEPFAHPPLTQAVDGGVLHSHISALTHRGSCSSKHGFLMIEFQESCVTETSLDSSAPEWDQKKTNLELVQLLVPFLSACFLIKNVSFELLSSQPGIEKELKMYP